MAFVRPLLEYSDAVWDNCSLETKKQLDAIHVEAAQIITGATNYAVLKSSFLILDGSLFKVVEINTNW